MSQQSPSGRGGPPGDPPVSRYGALIVVVSIVAVLVAVGIGAVLLMHRGDGSGASGRTKPATVPTSTAPTLPTETPTLPTETPTRTTGTSTLATETPSPQSGAPSRPTPGPHALHSAPALRAAQLFLSAAKGGRCTDAFGLADGIFKKSFQAETTCGATVRRALTGWTASTNGAFDRFGPFGTYTFADGTTVTLHQIGGRWKVSSFLPPY